MKPALGSSTSFRRSQRHGSTIVVLVSDNHASKLAFKMAKALLRPKDELHLLTVVLGEDSMHYGSNLLAPYLESECPSGTTVTPVVLVKGDQRLGDAINAYVSTVGADMLATGSQNLCVDGTRGDPLPAAGSFALRLVKLVRCCPVLVVKANSQGPYIRSSSSALGLKVMVECRSNTRHMLQWLMDQMDADKDSVFLAVTKAQDQGTGMVKETATRMLTNFSVQAGTNDFYTAQRMFKDAGGKALPQAVEADGIDILAVQAPECKQLPDALLDLLQTARTSLLVYNHKTDDAHAAHKADMEPMSAAVAAVAAAGRRHGMPRVTM